MKTNAETPIGDLLRRTRLAAKITVRAVAAKVVKPNGHNISPSFVTDIEKGRRVPSDFVAKQLAAVFCKPASKWVALAKQSRRRG